VELVALAGSREVYGLQAKINGKLEVKKPNPSHRVHRGGTEVAEARLRELCDTSVFSV